jgi:hypothetical protein
VRAKLAAALHTSVDTLRRTRVVGTDTIPWFQAVGIAPDTSAHLSTWYMEYDPDYVGRAFPEVPPARRGITRAAVLAPRFDSTRLLGDITGATLALNEGERAQFVAELRALGYSIRTRGGATIAAGPGVTFAFVPATAGRHGLRELRLSLRRRPEPRVITLGTSELRLLRDGTAAWTF